MTLPALIDYKGIMEEVGISKNAAYHLMDKFEKITIKGYRRVYVRRSDVEEYLRGRAAA